MKWALTLRWVFALTVLGTAGAAPWLSADEIPRRKPLSSNLIRQEKQVDAFGYPLATADKAESVDLLRQRQYGKLDQILRDYQREAESSFRYEDWIGDAIEAFAIPDPAYRPSFDEWLEQMPQSAVAHLARGAYWNGMAWAARGHQFAAETTTAQLDAMRDYHDRALKDVRQAIQLNPRFGEAYRYLVNIHSANSRTEESRKALEDGTTVAPHSFRLRAAFMMSLLPRWGGSYPAMEAFAADSEKFADVNPRLKVLRGYIAWDRGKRIDKSERSKRRAAFEEALSHGPHALFYESLGDAYRDAHRQKEALQNYFNAQAVKPQEARVLGKIARALVSLDQIDQASAALAAADDFDLAGAERDRRAKLAARLLVVRGHAAYRKGDSEEALAALKSAQRTNPGNASTRYWQGRAYLKEGDFAKAFDEFKSAIQIDPRHIESIKNIDYLLAREGKWDEILPYWDAYLRLEPTSAEGYLERGGTYFHKGDRAHSLADARRACELGSAKGCEMARRYGSAPVKP